MIRKLVFTPILTLYCGIIVLAAWHPPFLPRVLERPQELAIQTLQIAGIAPGMRVFSGPPQRLELLMRARCTVVDGIDAAGRKTRIYPTPEQPCPPTGLRWTPVVYEHMILHWMAWIRLGDFRSNLSAMGDHFCQVAANPKFTHVEIFEEIPVRHYETGEEWTMSENLGRVECRR